jgi:hypothetical protein
MLVLVIGICHLFVVWYLGFVFSFRELARKPVHGLLRAAILGLTFMSGDYGLILGLLQTSARHTVRIVTQ